MKKLQQIPKKLEEIQRIREAISKAILELPDNPRIQRISDNPRCFVMSSKDVFSPNQYGYTDMRIKNNMSVFFHDFKAQYELIAEVLKKSHCENIISTLQYIIKNGTLKGRNYRRFHPDVIKHLGTLLAS